MAATVGFIKPGVAAAQGTETGNVVFHLNADDLEVDFAHVFTFADFVSESTCCKDPPKRCALELEPAPGIAANEERFAWRVEKVLRPLGFEGGKVNDLRLF